MDDKSLILWYIKSMKMPKVIKKDDPMKPKVDPCFYLFDGIDDVFYSDVNNQLFLF